HMRIQIIQVGKTKHQFITAAEQEYSKRLSPWADLKIITLKESSTDSTSEHARQKTKSAEAAKILEVIPKDSFVIALDETGKQFTSVEFAEKINHLKDFQGANLTFIIGGPFGLAEEVKKQASLLLSFSKFTFTHEMIRALLLEQLYRAFTIISNKTYHY
ncbi:23S rRNA (pseudouridine(1915)-N(3))-methyltransferase RlmH, partial [Candidatus Peregrinibacteria bacterium]|nr:23S rRNA (pseudouridine(1915)-N(3))-methyltransferase RlmH [Candidatus Peregrinibacteria bacterium]